MAENIQYTKVKVNSSYCKIKMHTNICTYNKYCVHEHTATWLMTLKISKLSDFLLFTSESRPGRAIENVKFNVDLAVHTSCHPKTVMICVTWEANRSNLGHILLWCEHSPSYRDKRERKRERVLKLSPITPSYLLKSVKLSCFYFTGVVKFACGKHKSLCGNI